ncbi:Rod shape-determining protein MreC [hydrothermal vent metagenome]|uniref:Cell shape-determining protein MreC n=1 Tax=hydrothermal vent metagenome TaxID=652676 RepID=A0A1W1CD63_9ZZZZ
MKTKTLVVSLFLLVVLIITTRNDDRLIDTLLSIVNPIKQTYTNIIRDIEGKSQSYVYQKDSIERLTKENKFLRKRLLEQKHYIQQVKDLYEIIPSLEKIPRRSVDIVQTISYVKLNSFSQVILTKPNSLDNNDSKRLYGLIQGDVVAGVARVYNHNLYGSLISNEKCRFSVFVGENRAAGIAMGIKSNEMYVKFIPKWADIKKGDKVVTSGLDTIFFADIPVGEVESVEVESSYKIAYIKAYANVLKPDYFYLIKDPSVTLTSAFDGKVISRSANKHKTTADKNNTIINMFDPSISSIPSVITNEPESISQTTTENINPEHEIPPSEAPQKHTNRNKPKVNRPKIENLDMF